MEIIKTYLENMFASLPKTDKILRLKNDILSNMEERYHELKGQGKLENEAIGIVISEFGNIDELLEEMNLKPQEEFENIADKEGYPSVSFEETTEYLKAKERALKFISTGVWLIISGVAAMIIISQLIQQKLIFDMMSDGSKDALPVILLLGTVAAAVGMFIYSGLGMEKYKFIEDGLFEVSSETKAILQKEFNNIKPKQVFKIIIGVSLCIISPVFVIFAGSLFKGEEYGAAVMLFTIAIAVFLLIKSSITEGYKKLLKLEEFNPQFKKENKVINAVAGIVWPLVVAIYLYCGFVLNLWHISWIIFPITGVLFGGFSSMYKAIRDK